MAKEEVTRMCMACRQVKPKSYLIRIVKTADGDVAVDVSGKADGRGAYVCKDISCVQAARKKRSFSRAFRREVPDAVYRALEQMVDENGP